MAESGLEPRPLWLSSGAPSRTLDWLLASWTSEKTPLGYSAQGFAKRWPRVGLTNSTLGSSSPQGRKPSRRTPGQPLGWLNGGNEGRAKHQGLPAKARGGDGQCPVLSDYPLPRGATGKGHGSVPPPTVGIKTGPGSPSFSLVRR